jgi:hypothetical protein
MSWRFPISKTGGWSDPPLSTEARVLESPSARVGSPVGSVTPVLSSGGSSSSTMQGGKRSSVVAMWRFHRVSPGGGFVSSARASEGWCCIASSKLISSTIAMGGDQGRRLRRVVAKANARSKLRIRLRLDSALYQAAPLRDFPLSLGMGRILVRAPVKMAASRPGFGGGRSFSPSRMNTASDRCIPSQFITAKTHQAVVTAEAIKAGWLVLCRLVQFPRARGLIDWKWRVQAIAYLVFGGRSPVDAINGRPDDRPRVCQCARVTPSGAPVRLLHKTHPVHSIQQHTQKNLIFFF